MGADSKIEWCHHTFNPWRGCSKISPGCANCYAEKLSHRNPATLGVWGNDGVRAMASEPYWRQPIAWDRAAKAAGERHRVFCASLADVFEDRPELVAPRVRLFHLINETPNLDWLLLTKRPENIRRFHGGPGVPRCWPENMPPNVWLGTSVEDQQRADERISELLKVRAQVRFLSIEPLLSRVTLTRFMICRDCSHIMPSVWNYCPAGSRGSRCRSALDWVIVGGESGKGARPMAPEWPRGLRDQCLSAGVPFFFKQWGEWAPYDRGSTDSTALATPGALDRPLGKFGKAASGRMLDGRTWDEFPEVQP